MRITGGQAKGRLLASLKGLYIRPSSGRVKEAVFNLIGQDITGAKVLDLFAGTGSLGIEALSRGALWALFIDNSQQSIKLIRKNLRLCGYEPLGFVLKRDLIRGLPWRHSLMKKKFDLVFIDPPYGKKFILPILKELSDREILLSPSVVVAETSRTDNLPSVLGKLELVKTRAYGETRINIYHYGDNTCREM
ncbi:MAG: 16S rRNA (guanine(966)-N(2))-methyltransferase RsmD [Deltaproteobacteria bacterium]|nr:16S rRNA (guanine(966)-N(2))-methyltransferase RsmD [Deltaproteobacteria bacterium]